MSERIVVSDKDYAWIRAIQKREQLDTIKETISYLLDMEDWKVNNDGK